MPAILASLLLVLVAYQEPYPVGNGVSAPVVISRETPAYPQQAKDARIEGEVVLSVVVDESGIPAAISVTKSLESSLDSAAIAAVRLWRFKPGMKDGHPVAVRATLSVSFKLL